MQERAGRPGLPNITVHQSQDTVRVSSPGPVTVDITVSSPSKAPQDAPQAPHSPASMREPHAQGSHTRTTREQPSGPASSMPAWRTASSSRSTSEGDSPPLTAGYARNQPVAVPDVRPDAEAQYRPRSSRGSRDRPTPRARASRVGPCLLARGPCRTACSRAQTLDSRAWGTGSSILGSRDCKTHAHALQAEGVQHLCCIT